MDNNTVTNKQPNTNYSVPSGMPSLTNSNNQNKNNNYNYMNYGNGMYPMNNKMPNNMMMNQLQQMMMNQVAMQQLKKMQQKQEKKNTIFREFEYDKTPIVDLVNQMIVDAYHKRVSDIHFDPTPDVLNVRVRIDGELVLYAKVPASVKKNLSTRIKIIAGMNITEMRLPQDGAIKMEVDKNPLDMRVSSLPIVDGEKIVIRILDYSRSKSGMESLGLTESNLEKVERMLKVPNGIILITGATGSGKSTTVYAMLEKLNDVSTNIITVEDPVEMKLPGLNQVQVMSEIGMDFAAALRSILRQDPDVIMIGEIRDEETARMAVRASITGHLVLSTLHTNNALNTIERLLDMNVERYLLGSSLTGVIAQRLCKKLCPKCRKARELSNYEKIVFRKALDDVPDIIYDANAQGCSNCVKGYVGRVAIHEVMMLNQDIRDAITTGKNKEILRDMVYNHADTKNILQDVLFKVKKGDTSFEEALRITDIEEDFGSNEQELKNALLGKTTEEEIEAFLKEEEERNDKKGVKVTNVEETDNTENNTLDNNVVTEEVVEDKNVSNDNDVIKDNGVKEQSVNFKNIDDVLINNDNSASTPISNEEAFTIPTGEVTNNNIDENDEEAFSLPTGEVTNNNIGENDEEAFSLPSNEELNDVPTNTHDRIDITPLDDDYIENFTDFVDDIDTNNENKVSDNKDKLKIDGYTGKDSEYLFDGNSDIDDTILNVTSNNQENKNDYDIL